MFYLKISNTHTHSESNFLKNTFWAHGTLKRKNLNLIFFFIQTKSVSLLYTGNKKGKGGNSHARQGQFSHYVFGSFPVNLYRKSIIHIFGNTKIIEYRLSFILESKSQYDNSD